ncbi:MAG: hypothetical protein HYV26_22005 [Candidatus Hydrogenedentes bacterium]|nr:hypothetical protein [Candidatus Hydrogenedentota bacterium]MBI3119391.1 hypothetical protein [Candidatus Hydrogenedentota bacterium]
MIRHGITRKSGPEPLRFFVLGKRADTKRRVLKWLLYGAFIPILTASASADQAPAQFDIQMVLCEVAPSASVPWDSASEWKGPFDASGKRKLGKYEITGKDDRLLWDGKETPSAPDIKILSSPRISTLEGQEVIIENVTRMPVAYFAPAGPEHPGLYAHKVDFEDIGTAIKITVQSMEKPDEVRVELTCTVTSLPEDSEKIERQKLDGVAFDVGRVVIDKAEATGVLKTPCGTWTVFPLPNNRSLLFFRVQPAVQECKS